MAKATLTISSKNYSSWSLRGWLLTKFSGLPFVEITTSRSTAALNWLNFFAADVATGVGPFLAIYLAANRHWQPGAIGIFGAGALMLGLDGEIGVVAEGMIADLIIVDGDPVADITVLQRRECIQTVIQDGRVVEFDEEMIARSWPHDRGITYSVGDLTYDVVHGHADPDDPALVTAGGPPGPAQGTIQQSNDIRQTITASGSQADATKAITDGTSKALRDTHEDAYAALPTVGGF